MWNHITSVPRSCVPAFTVAHPKHNSLAMHINLHYTPSNTQHTVFHNPPLHTINQHKAYLSKRRQNGTRCRDGAKVLWCHAHLFWFLGIPSLLCYYTLVSMVDMVYAVTLECMSNAGSVWYVGAGVLLWNLIAAEHDRYRSIEVCGVSNADLFSVYGSEEQPCRLAGKKAPFHKRFSLEP